MAKIIINGAKKLDPYGLPGYEIQVAELEAQNGIPKGWYAFEFVLSLNDFVLYSGPESCHSEEAATLAAVAVIQAWKANRLLQLIVPKPGEA